ncbi:type II secretion system F family protein [Nocardiopsis coralliicola]
MTAVFLALAGAALAGAVFLAYGGRSVSAVRLSAAAPQRPEPRAIGTAERTPGRGLQVACAMAPAAALAAAAGLPAALLLGPPLGAACWWGLRRTAGRPSRPAASAAGLPLAVDLLAAGVRAGGETTAVLSALAPSVGGPLGALLSEVADRQRLGEAPGRAWAAVGGPPEVAAVGRTLDRAAQTGAPVADLLDRHAEEAREQARVRAAARAQRAAVLVVAPLGLCFLPAFVLIGVLPLVAGLIGGAAP